MPVAAAEDQPKKEYKPFDPSILQTVGGDFEEYIKYPVEEPIQAHITDIKIGRKFNRTSGQDEDRVYFYFETDEGDGKGQTYRADYSPKITKGGSKQSNLSLMLEKVYGETQDGIDYQDILGRPVRIELSEPWGEKGLQFVNAVKRPTASQKRVEVAKDTVVADIDSQGEDAVMAAIDAFGGGEVVE